MCDLEVENNITLSATFLQLQLQHINEAPMPHTEGEKRGTHSTMLSLKRKSDQRFKTDLDVNFYGKSDMCGGL